VTDIKQSQEVDDIGSKIRDVLYQWYGADVKAIMLWLPPGTTKLDLYTNVMEQALLIQTLRGVLKTLESKPLDDLTIRQH
jgi:hypothetical protein